jgi:hypothetical protein
MGFQSLKVGEKWEILKNFEKFFNTNFYIFGQKKFFSAVCTPILFLRISIWSHYSKIPRLGLGISHNFFIFSFKVDPFWLLKPRVDI